MRAGVSRFTYGAMRGAENIMQLAITQAHKKGIAAPGKSGMEYRIVRPCGAQARSHHTSQLLRSAAFG